MAQPRNDQAPADARYDAARRAAPGPAGDGRSGSQDAARIVGPDPAGGGASSSDQTAPAAHGGGWRHLLRQGAAVCRLELGKTLLGRRAIPLVVLAALPVLIFSGRALLPERPGPFSSPGFAIQLYAGIFQSFMLRFVFYFGCVLAFMNLFRGDLLERSLHYYFLSPIRREVLVGGKYAAGLIATALLFGLSTALSYLLMLGSPDAAAATGPGPAHLAWYLVVTWLACVGYGAVFLLVGLFLRNPIVPAVLILGWESMIFLLPPLLKKVSVAYYLQSLCPVQLSGGPFEILAEPSPPSIAVPGVLGVAIACLALACWRARRMEILYTAE